MTDSQVTIGQRSFGVKEGDRYTDVGIVTLGLPDHGAFDIAADSAKAGVASGVRFSPGCGHRS